MEEIKHPNNLYAKAKSALCHTLVFLFAFTSLGAIAAEEQVSPQTEQGQGISILNNLVSKPNGGFCQPENLEKAEAGDAKAQLFQGVCGMIGWDRSGLSPVTWIEKAANQNLPAAQIFMGGIMIGKNKRDEGEAWFTKAAKQGDAQGQALLAMMKAAYFRKTQDPKYKDEAFQWAILSANQNHPDGETALGMLYLENHEYADALQWFQKAASQGKPDALFELGKMYLEGQGIKPDLTQAVEQFRKAAEFGYSSAQVQLALLYRTGEGVTKDTAHAIALLHKAADNGHDAQAQFELAKLYRDGNEIPKDTAKADTYLRQSAEQNYAPAKKEIEKHQP